MRKDNVNMILEGLNEGRRLNPDNEKYKGYTIRLETKHGVSCYNIYDSEGELEDTGFRSKEAAERAIDDLCESSIQEGADYDFTKEDDKKKACDEYSKCMQNGLSSSAEKRMDELDKLADGAGLKFYMTNYSAYMQPRALVKPRYELVEK